VGQKVLKSAVMQPFMLHQIMRRIIKQATNVLENFFSTLHTRCVHVELQMLVLQICIAYGRHSLHQLVLERPDGPKASHMQIFTFIFARQHLMLWKVVGEVQKFVGPGNPSEIMQRTLAIECYEYVGSVQIAEQPLHGHTLLREERHFTVHPDYPLHVWVQLSQYIKLARGYPKGFDDYHVWAVLRHFSVDVIIVYYVDKLSVYAAIV
jgi:hypothetical protein